MVDQHEILRVHTIGRQPLSFYIKDFERDSPYTADFVRANRGMGAGDPRNDRVGPWCRKEPLA